MLCVVESAVLTHIQEEGVLATGDCLKQKSDKAGTPSSFGKLRFSTEVPSQLLSPFLSTYRVPGQVT